jgi:hypothetical protein
MVEIVAMSVAAAFGMLFLILKFGNIRRVLAFDIGIDIGLTALLMFSMAGTFMGIMVAIFAGGILSILLYCLKKCFPPDTLTPRGWVPSKERTIIDWYKSSQKQT